MRAIEAEKGILKLVHTGRHVETRTEPIIASEVLKRNPRHSVTRPDVFEYPWIVVRPESVLKLGRVFYIVPNLAIYKLIIQKGYNVQSSLEQKKPPKSYVHWQLPELDSPSKSSAGTTPMHQDHCQSDWQQFKASCEDGNLQEQASGDRFNRSSQFESLADMMAKFRNSYKEFKEISITNCTSETEPMGRKPNRFRGVGNSKTKASKQDQASGNECEKQIATILKPCSRKHDSDRKLLHLKVSFSLSTNYEERRRKVALSRAEFPGLFTY
ncbi:Phototropic-responsive NPH3 family protein [Hibiscus syriacus]|uniref:Phototropic-responsive NPH3 family protein n=1 Tax=Hibiscus syriacus TaxID=106335 RepID=A0A6A2XPC9_HIBSY|nr:Phototropic-responsive NPH3 family protein [Hibiscus syriacus]